MSLVYQRYRSSFTVRLWSAVRLQLVQITCRQQVDFLFFQYFNTFIHITRTNHNVCHVIYLANEYIYSIKTPSADKNSQHFCQSSRHIRTANADHICYIHGKNDYLFNALYALSGSVQFHAKMPKISIFQRCTKAERLMFSFASTSVTSVKTAGLVFSKR